LSVGIALVKVPLHDEVSVYWFSARAFKVVNKPMSASQDKSNSRRACFFDLAGETAIFTLSPSAVKKPNNRSNE
jgi:hypothetical protein